MKNKSLLAFLVMILALSGCAALRQPGRVKLLPIPNYYVNNNTYYPLKGLCGYFNIQWDYDSIGRQVTLKGPNTEIRLLIDSSVVLVNNIAVDIRAPVIIHEGNVSLPWQFKQNIIDRFFAAPSVSKTDQFVLGQRVKKVVVDAGHGGHDPGAIGRSGLREKDVNLDIAKRLTALLRANGIEVLMTRVSDEFISLEERAKFTNKSRADLFISVHSNSAASSRLNGFEVYYITDKINDSQRALTSAQRDVFNIEGSFYDNSTDIKALIWDMIYTDSRAKSIVLAQSICHSADKNMGLKILGVKAAKFFVLKGSNIPAVLVEVGFLSNPYEEKYLRNGFYRQQLAEAIGEGVFDYGSRYDNLSRHQR